MPNERFWLQNTRRKRCLKVEDDSIIGANCSSPTLDMLWIWPRGTNNRKLMNVKTLQCLKRQYGNNKKVFISDCWKGSTNLQNMKCDNANKLRWTSNAYLHLNPQTNIAISRRSTEQTWKSDKTPLCGSKTNYKGTILYLSLCCL